MDLIESVFVRNSLIVAFAAVGVVMWVSYFLADKLTNGRIHGSAIAIALGLLAAYFGGVATGGNTGVADVRSNNAMDARSLRRLKFQNLKILTR